MQFHQSVPLAPYTTFRIGGPASWFAEASEEEHVTVALEFARARNLPLFVLGGGSNLLVSDAGYPGLVLHLALRGIVENGAENRLDLQVAASENWDELVSFAVNRGYAGIECLAGIPGTVGATPVQNVGAYGQEVAETITSLRAYDTERNQFVELGARECGFAYRRSIFNTAARGRYILTQVRYRLRGDAQPNLAYADLQRYFAGHSGTPSLAETSAAVREIRRGKGMLIVEGDSDCRSAGSFFKNPIVTQAHFERIAAACASRVPSYPAETGKVKLPAAWLVEQAGFAKGFRSGAAGISSRHTLALINRDHAMAADILALRDQIAAAVDEKFGIRLEMEPILLQ
jgi:UDP-N-acetylmuramate dehydrogenase